VSGDETINNEQPSSINAEQEGSDNSSTDVVWCVGSSYKHQLTNVYMSWVSAYQQAQ
jgi:hypothetical protein